MRSDRTRAASVRPRALGPWGPTAEAHRAQAPHLIAPAGGQCRRPWRPLWDGARAMEGLGPWPWPTHARVRPPDRVVHLDQRQRRPQARGLWAPRGDSPPHGRHRRAQVQMQALDNRRRDRPPPRGPPQLAGRSPAAPYPGRAPHEASTPISRDDLGLEPRGGALESPHPGGRRTRGLRRRPTSGGVVPTDPHPCGTRPSHVISLQCG
jgi:hypothetical protein